VQTTPKTKNLFSRRVIIWYALAFEFIIFFLIFGAHSEIMTIVVNDTSWRITTLLALAYQYLVVAIYLWIPSCKKQWLTNFQNAGFVIIFLLPMQKVIIYDIPEYGTTITETWSPGGGRSVIKMSGAAHHDFSGPILYTADKNARAIFFARTNIAAGSEISMKNIKVISANPHQVKDVIFANSNNYSCDTKKSDKSLIGRITNRDIKEGSPILCEYVSPIYVQ